MTRPSALPGPHTAGAPLNEQEVLARGAALIERAGNPQILIGLLASRRLHRPVVMESRGLKVRIVASNGSFRSRFGQITVSKAACAALPPDMIDAGIAHEIGHCVHCGTPAQLARELLATYLRPAAVLTARIAGFGFLAALVLPGRLDPYVLAAASLTLALAAVLSQLRCHLTRRIEYAADLYAADLVGAAPVIRLLGWLHQNNQIAARRYVLFFVLGRVTHPTFGRRIQRVIRHAVGTDERDAERTPR